ncbi:MAG: restriction endonuclease [Ardenticatenaceae bacterium]|nr:restriction endonuclease [Ardenticatenaceae bacterium]
MAVPDFQSLMLPLMVLAQNGKEHTNSEVSDKLAEIFQLTEQDLKEQLPSGRQTRFNNRVGWAITHLRKAVLLESVGRGRFHITERGKKVLLSNPERIDLKFLKQFPEFVEFRTSAKQNDDQEMIELTSDQTPEESLESSYQELRQELAQEILRLAKSCTPSFFERLVVDLLVEMGYGGSRKDAGQAVGQSGDGGIDGIIKEDKLGLDVVYIQAKRWEGTVGRPVVQTFAGSLEGFRARKGVLITTSNFSNTAKDYVNRIEKKIVLIDGDQLAQLMIDHGVGVSEVASYTIKKIDLDYFETE